MAFLNRQIDGKIVFGIYGVPTRRVRGIVVGESSKTGSEIAPFPPRTALPPRTAMTLFEDRLRQTMAVNLGAEERQQRVLDSIHFRFIPVAEPNGEDRYDFDHSDRAKSPTQRFVIAITVSGRNNDDIFRVKVGRLCASSNHSCPYAFIELYPSMHLSLYIHSTPSLVFSHGIRGGRMAILGHSVDLSTLSMQEVN